MTARLLLAEDEDVLRMLVVDSLEDCGYEIDEAVDGVEAFEKIQENSYDLVLLDYMMPGMTGLEVVEKTRRLAGKHDVKIMMLTAKSQKSDQDLARKTGVDYFLAKPFSPMELVNLIEGILDEK
ncbi:response regulator [Tumebacillus permanentifrigoris]|uniref:Response regulator receiver domain-containing protein n=1 Tax=Tumebacillus permanentifrigoris TaxID=378543 RepID=A0A316D6V4_9BACL|nr:response regulator [Tumebacillus permanentifrigoris]PWK07950.1 response regulator receiver domain-containing protein [Tumebacillus permanentifrigoris]